MNIRYYIDPDTMEPHIYNHRVVEEEVEDVLGEPGEILSGRNGARIAVGQTIAGRYLRVIFVDGRPPDDFFVITAYELNNQQKLAYRRRKRRRGR